jgi:hypothetical protein
MFRVIESRMFALVIFCAASLVFAFTVLSTKIAYANLGWQCAAGGPNGCKGDLGLDSVQCGGPGGPCVECVSACAADTTPTKVCAIGTNSGTCGALSRGCDFGVTTSTCGCIPYLCGCELLGCFQGPCMGTSVQGSYQYDCVGV